MAQKQILILHFLLGESGYPTTADWLVDVIPSGGAVGAYPQQVRTGDSSHSPAKSISRFIQNKIITLIF